MKKNVIAINGSPRKKWNTATLLERALAGAASQGAETELIHLYDLHYQGCISCFACKIKGGKSYGKCAYRDDLTAVLNKIEQADAIILGSPIYLGAVTGEMRSFLERLIFPYLVYDENSPSLFNKQIATGFIYTMNMNESRMNEAGYDGQFKLTEKYFAKIFGAAESLVVTDTYQFDDYSKYVATKFNSAAKAKRRQAEFPKDCQAAFAMGARFVSGVNSDGLN